MGFHILREYFVPKFVVHSSIIEPGSIYESDPITGNLLESLGHRVGTLISFKLIFIPVTLLPIPQVLQQKVSRGRLPMAHAPQQHDNLVGFCSRHTENQLMAHPLQERERTHKRVNLLIACLLRWVDGVLQHSLDIVFEYRDALKFIFVRLAQDYVLEKALCNELVKGFLPALRSFVRLQSFNILSHAVFFSQLCECFFSRLTLLFLTDLFFHSYRIFLNLLQANFHLLFVGFLVLFHFNSCLLDLISILGLHYLHLLHILCLLSLMCLIIYIWRIIGHRAFDKWLDMDRELRNRWSENVVWNWTGARK